MSVLVTGLLGVALKVAPELFKVLAADRDDGDIRDATVEIIKNLAKTADPKEADKKIDQDPLLRAKIKQELAALEVKALEEQKRTAEEQSRIDIAFIELENAEREQQHRQQIELLNSQLERTERARKYAQRTSESNKWWISGINPVLTLLITVGFIVVLYFIMKPSVFLATGKIENMPIIYAAIGALTTGFATVIAFHFGSSAGSKEKDELILNSPPDEKSNLGPIPGREPKQEGPGAESTQGTGVASTSAKKAALPDPGGTFGLFRQKAPAIMSNLMSELGLTLDQAAGVLGNIGHECAGFRMLQEVKPIVPGSRGGWGWCQWTGPRRRAFEKWCQDNGFNNLSADEANYGFLKHELEGAEIGALQHLRKSVSLRHATESFMEKYERPGVKHLESRMNWAKQALNAYRNSMN